MILQQLMMGPSFLELSDRGPEAQSMGCIFLAFLVSCMTLFFQVCSAQL